MENEIKILSMIQSLSQTYIRTKNTNDASSTEISLTVKDALDELWHEITIEINDRTCESCNYGKVENILLKYRIDINELHRDLDSIYDNGYLKLCCWIDKINKLAFMEVENI